MAYRWKKGEELASWKAEQRHQTTILIAAGLVRPRPLSCEQCGATPGLNSVGSSKIHMHHPDYERPELVQWLCGSCHRRASHRFPAINSWADCDRWRQRRAARRVRFTGTQLALFEAK